jgi:hypothetical protein
MGRDGRDRAGQASHHEGCLHPRIEWIGEAPEKAKMDHLHHEAHEVCIANSVKTLVTVTKPHGPHVGTRKYGAGSIGFPAMSISKYTWVPTVTPVLPTSPSFSPAATVLLP